MTFELIRDGRPYGSWLSTGEMVIDLMRGSIKLEPGDKIFVRSETPRPRSHLRLVQSEHVA